MADELEDIQSSADDRGLAIDKVGVCDLRYPITVLDRQNEKQHTSANISLSVSLPHHFNPCTILDNLIQKHAIG